MTKESAADGWAGSATMPLHVAGVMSGTSGDGVDAALCRIHEEGGAPQLRVVGHRHTPYPPALREAVLRAMSPRLTRTSELTRLSWRLGLFYAECLEEACGVWQQAIDLVGCHGQTVYHQGAPGEYLGRTLGCTWQIGEASVMAQRLRSPVVSDFRSADIAAGGQGAPLVPMLDWALLRSAHSGRVLQNLGGIANLTAIPTGGALDQVLAFDTGPANMVIDACMRRLLGQEFDRDGEVARQGKAVEPVVRSLLRLPYFAVPPPKSCGREQFGEAFAQRLIRRCRAQGASDADIIATATALTARSVLEAYAKFMASLLAGAPVECVLSGGGAKNRTLVELLRAGWEAMGVTLLPIEHLGLSSEAKEAAAFALLAWLTWHRRPGNVPSATGASRPVVLGRITYASA